MCFHRRWASVSEAATNGPCPQKVYWIGLSSICEVLWTDAVHFKLRVVVNATNLGKQTERSLLRKILHSSVEQPGPKELWLNPMCWFWSYILSVKSPDSAGFLVKSPLSLLQQESRHPVAQPHSSALGPNRSLPHAGFRGFRRLAAARRPVHWTWKCWGC